MFGESEINWNMDEHSKMSQNLICRISYRFLEEMRTKEDQAKVNHHLRHEKMMYFLIWPT